MAKGKAKAKKAKKAVVAIGVDKYKEDVRMVIADQCEGCERIEEVDDKKLCTKYVEPEFHWENDQICSFATHVKKEVKVVKKNLNPLKASKRAAGKK